MAKFSSATAVKRQRPILRSPIKTTSSGVPTYEGGEGYSRDAKSDLFLLAVTNMVGENTFYESSNDRDARFAKLIHQVTEEDPKWMQGFIPFLRNEMFMRSASVVAAAEYVAAHGPLGPKVVDSAMSRPDEPGELLAYWHQTYGRNEPMPIKKGVARAALRLYDENAALKYDGVGNGWRLGDVIERVHPASDSALFSYLLDRVHNPENIRVDMSKLPKIDQIRKWDALDDASFKALLLSDPDLLANSGYTWERLSTRMKMDKEAWEAIIPAMGYMALLRNLRNFEEAGIGSKAQSYVSLFLSDPDKVARSKQFPFRFLTAYLNTSGLSYAPAIERGLNLSVRNIPQVQGKTLVLIDVSGSMTAALSQRSTVERWKAGALFGVAQAFRSDNVDVVAFGTDSAPVVLPNVGGSVLRGVQAVESIVRSGHLGYGTNTWQAVTKHFNGHDRVFIFTDEQSRDDSSIVAGRQIKTIYNFNLAGYSRSNMNLAAKGRYEFGGFSDATFRLIDLLERGKNALWPWEC